VSAIHSRRILGIALMLAAVVGVSILRLMIYREPNGGTIEFAWPDDSIWRYRWTPLVIGVVVGAALAISGVLLQALLRNPLAEPFILGISSGAGLGVMAAMYLAYAMTETRGTTDTRTIPAILGALAALAVVYALGQRRGLLDPILVVLIGVIVSAVCGAGIMFFQHLVPTGLAGEFTLWLMGNIPQDVSRTTLWSAGLLTCFGAASGVVMGRAMDAATLGDDEAQSVGLAIDRLRLLMFALAGVLTAVTVSLAGPIGFVGLIGPHAARLLVGSRHGLLVIGAALCGIILVVGSDVARQLIDFGAGRMPIGIFTALIGGPAFIYLLLSGKGQS
jgi:iron complex transport system permease protein